MRYPAINHTSLVLLALMASGLGCIPSTAWSDVEAPLLVEIEMPEDGFQTGQTAKLLLSAWIPELDDRDESAIEMTLTGLGVAQVSGQSVWRFDNIAVGVAQRAVAKVVIAGDGEGEWRLEATSFDADGQRMWGRAATLFVLQADGEVLYGKSSDYHLLVEKLEKDREKGLVDDSAYRRNLEKLRASEALDFQRALKGLPPEDVTTRMAAPAKVAETTVSGRITYTHRTGRDAGANQFATAENARPLVGMLVEFYDRQGTDVTQLATNPAEVRTDAEGQYANVRVPGQRADETAVNLEVWFLFNSPAATIGTALDNTNFVRAPAVLVESANLDVSVVVDNTNLDNLRRAHIHEMALFCYNETRSLISKLGTGVAPVQISVHFPNPAGANGSYFWTVGGDHIAMGRNHGFDWDVFTHEYGHYLQKLNDTARNPGGQHFIDGNLSGFRQRNAAGEVTRTLTKEQGVQMAWAEGWPTYYGTFLQIAGGTGALGIHTAGDLVYTDTANTFSYHLEENASLSRARGEDVELAVQRILWDFADAPQDENDEVIFGHERLWTLLHSDPKPLTLEAFRAKMENESPLSTPGYDMGTTQQNRVRYGGIYHDHGVGPAPTAPADGFSSAEPPKFTWQRKGAGPAPSYRFNLFNVQFYDKDFKNIIFTSPEIPTAAGALTDDQNAEWTPTEEQWNEIIEHGEILHWGVLGKHDGAPATGPYLGLTRTIGGASIAFVIDDTGSMGSEIAGVRQGLTQFISALRLFEDFMNPRIEVVTFKDNVTHRIASQDLDAIQAVVDSLGATGGGDCPEASAQALSAGIKNVASGGTIIFATDASPHAGYSLERVKAKARAKGVIINQIVTGDCESSSPDKANKDWDDAVIAASCNPDYIPGPESEAVVEYWHDVFCLDCPEDDSVGKPMTPNILKLVGDWTLPQVSSVAAFTDLASASPKGHFLYMPEAKWGDPTPFINAVANTALSAVAPTVLAAQPTSGPQGVTMDVLLAGGSTNFRNTSTVTFSGEGIVVNGREALSETELLVNITIDAEAETGFRDVSVTTPLGADALEEAGGTGQFEIAFGDDTPRIVSVAPRMIGQGTTETLTISGFNTNFADEVTDVVFGAGITVDEVAVISPIRLQVTITIAEDAPIGFRRITVTTDAENLTLDNVLTLVETLGLAEDAPEIASVTPNELPRSATNLQLTVTGKSTHFVDGESSASFSGAGITVASTTVTSATAAQVVVSVVNNAPLGARDMWLSTGGETAALIAGVVVVDFVSPEGEEEPEGEPEGESEGEGEGEDEDDKCCRGCKSSGDVTTDIKRFLGDYLLVGLALLTLLTFTTQKK